MNQVIPIFPLPIVQFPNAITPLHIFEPRYRQMLKDVMESDKTFGILYRPDDQDEAMPDLGPPPVGSIGCIVEVAVLQELPDGRSNILCVGISRFQLMGHVGGKAYGQAEVEFFDDEPTFDDLSVGAERAKRLFTRLLIASRKLKSDREEGTDGIPELPDDPQAVSFIGSAYLDIEDSDKEELLELTSTSARLEQVNEIMERLVKEYEKKAVVHHIAKKNGHGGKLPDLN